MIPVASTHVSCSTTGAGFTCAAVQRSCVSPRSMRQSTPQNGGQVIALALFMTTTTPSSCLHWVQRAAATAVSERTSHSIESPRGRVLVRRSPAD